MSGTTSVVGKLSIVNRQIVNHLAFTSWEGKRLSDEVSDFLMHDKPLC